MVLCKRKQARACRANAKDAVDDGGGGGVSGDRLERRRLCEEKERRVVLCKGKQSLRTLTGDTRWKRRRKEYEDGKGVRTSLTQTAQTDRLSDQPIAKEKILRSRAVGGHRGAEWE